VRLESPRSAESKSEPEEPRPREFQSSTLPAAAG
jgi:hypothetical protein